MAAPAWFPASLAVLMIVIAAYCAGRVIAAWRWGRATELDADGLHVVMGVAMAGMLLPRLSPAPASVWAAVFAPAGAWFTVRAIRLQRGQSPGGWLCGHPVPHLIECMAMLYMLLPSIAPTSGSPAAMPGMGRSLGATGSFRVLAVVLALFMVGYIIWTADVLAARTRARAGTASLGAAPQPAHAAYAARSAPARWRPSARKAFEGEGDGNTGHQAVPSALLAPRLASCYKIAMSMAMGYMLVQML